MCSWHIFTKRVLLQQSSNFIFLPAVSNMVKRSLWRDFTQKFIPWQTLCGCSSFLIRMPQIRTLCRIKPTAEYYPEFEASRNTLYLRVPEVLRENWENSVRGKANVSHEFNFDYIFKNTATQEEVFEVAAKEIIQGRTIYS